MRLWRLTALWSNHDNSVINMRQMHVVCTVIDVENHIYIRLDVTVN